MNDHYFDAHQLIQGIQKDLTGQLKQRLKDKSNLFIVLR